MSAFRAVIFDMDGVLLDSEPFHHAALNEVLAADGRSVSDEEYRPFIGSGEIRWEDLVRRFDLVGSPGGYCRQFDDAVTRQYRARSRLNPGAAELLAGLREAAVPLGVASNSKRRWVDAAIETLGIGGRFLSVVAADEVTKPKPAPDLYLAVAAGLGVPPAECIAVEDSLPGVQSARAAGTYVVGYRTPHTTGLDLPADEVIDTLYEFPLDRLAVDVALRKAG